VCREQLADHVVELVLLVDHLLKVIELCEIVEDLPVVLVETDEAEGDDVNNQNEMEGALDAKVQQEEDNVLEVKEKRLLESETTSSHE